MELKEIIALIKSWWWLILLLTAGAWVSAYFIYDKLPVSGAQKKYSATAQFEMPNDPLRIINFRNNASSRRVFIDPNTEMAHLRHRDTHRVAAEYYTLLEELMKAEAERVKENESDKAGDKAYMRQRYQQILKELQKRIEQGAEYVEEGSKVFPRGYLADTKNRPGSGDFLIAGIDINTIDLLKERSSPQAHEDKASDELRQLVAANLENVPSYEPELGRSNRIATLTVRGLNSETAAWMWANSLTLAASRESYRRMLDKVRSTLESVKNQLESENAPPSPARRQELINMADELMTAFQNRAAAEARGEYQLSSGAVDLLSYPTFTAENAPAERGIYYGHLIDRIRTAYPEVAASSLTSTPVGLHEREAYSKAKATVNGMEREHRVLENKREELNFEQQQFNAEYAKYVTLYRDSSRTEAYIPNSAIVSSNDMNRTRRELDSLQREYEELGVRYKPAADVMLRKASEIDFAVTQWRKACDQAFEARRVQLETQRKVLSTKQTSVETDLARARNDVATVFERRELLDSMSDIYGKAKHELIEAEEVSAAAAEYQRNLAKTRDEQGAVIRVFSFTFGATQSGITADAKQVASVVAFIVLAGSLIMLYMLTLARNKVTTEFDVRKHINLPVLSKLPRRPDADRSLLDISPRSAFAEQFSTVATLLRSYAKELSLRSILVTSAIKEEGKTDIACNLSIALARKGLKVLLIDADYHRSMVEKFFHVNATQGSMQFVEDPTATDLASYVTPSAAEGLDIMSPGGSVSDPVRLLESQRYAQMLKLAESEYDLVVIDSPPVARVGDALILASEVDATVFVVSSGDVTFADAALAKRLLTNVQANLLGVILNNSKDTRAREYYNYYYEGTRRRVRRVVD